MLTCPMASLNSCKYSFRIVNCELCSPYSPCHASALLPCEVCIKHAFHLRHEFVKGGFSYHSVLGIMGSAEQILKASYKRHAVSTLWLLK
jgi:hypothetical protein